MIPNNPKQAYSTKFLLKINTHPPGNRQNQYNTVNIHLYKQDLEANTFSSNRKYKCIVIDVLTFIEHMWKESEISALDNSICKRNGAVNSEKKTKPFVHWKYKNK